MDRLKDEKRNPGPPAVRERVSAAAAAPVVACYPRVVMRGRLSFPQFAIVPKIVTVTIFV